MKTLDEIAISCGTDKSSLGHAYTQYYEMFFEPLRQLPNNLLEIGIDKGDSLRMWREYMPITVVHGIDIRNGYDYLHDGIIITHVLDQSNEDELKSFGIQYDDIFHVIVDDGSHMSEDQILTFETLFPHLRSGGYYCIEDLLCDYDPRWNKGASSIIRIEEMVGEVQMNGAIPNSHICANKQEAVKKYDANYFEKNIEWIFVSCGLCIIKKM